MAAFQQPSWIMRWPQRFKPCAKSDGEERKKKSHGSWWLGDFYFSLGLPTSATSFMWEKDLCVIKSFIWATLICTDLSLNWNFFVILKMLIILQCVLNRSTSKEKTAVWYLSLCRPWKERSTEAMEGEKYRVALRFSLACLGAMKALKGMPIEVKKFKEGSRWTQPCVP